MGLFSLYRLYRLPDSPVAATSDASIVALGLADGDSTADAVLNRDSFLQAALEMAKRHGRIEDEEFTRRLGRKRAKYGRKPHGFGAAKVTRPRDAVDSAMNPDEEAT